MLPGDRCCSRSAPRSAPSGLVVLGGIGVVWLIVAPTVIVAALSGIYRTALYHFAADGQVPGEFAGIDFQDAFRPPSPRHRIPGLVGGFGGFSN